MNFTSPSEVAVMMGASTNQTHEVPVRQILVDVSVVVRADAQTGIQRVVRALLGALLDAYLNGYVVRPVYATRTDAYAYVSWGVPLLADRSADIHATTGRAITGQIEVGDGDIFLGLDLAANILPRHRRQIAGWQRKGCRIATVIYDLFPEQRPDWFNMRTRRNYRRWLRIVTRLSDQIICISPEIAGQLQAWVAERPWRGNARLRIDHMRLGSDIERSAPSRGMPVGADALLTLLAARRTLLVVGTIEPRKGHACVLSAVERLWDEDARSDVSLVFVGRPGWRTEKLQARMRTHPEAGGDRRFFWFDDASDEFLARLYDVAHGVIVPSFAEGFGLPLVEALGHGVPVLARDLPVFRGMRLANVSYFSQDDPVSLAGSIGEWLDRGGKAAAAPGENFAPTWKDSFDDLLSCLSITERRTQVQGHPGKHQNKDSGIL